MDENPAAETQSVSQMKNKKGLGCWGWGCLTALLGFIGCTAVIVPRFVGINSTPTTAAKNTLVTIYKECEYNKARNRSATHAPLPRLMARSSGWRVSFSGDATTSTCTGNATATGSSYWDIFEGTTGDEEDWVITINLRTGDKTCIAGNNPAGCWRR